MSHLPSVTIAVLTYRRNAELSVLLPRLIEQAVGDEHDARILIVDNDPAQGARQLVEQHDGSMVRYASEPKPGIGAARNRALDETAEDLIVFIDDDETPVDGWLSALLATYARFHPSAVVGPVVRQYDGPVHPWVEAGGFRERARHATGTHMPIGATNNLLLDMRVIRARRLRFDPVFGLSGGSDTLFTRQLTKGGDVIVWCDEALVIDPMPAERSTRQWMMQRTFRLGNTWARVHVLTTDWPVQRLLMRVQLICAGAGRSILGTVQVLLGALLRDLGKRARGTRLILRGAGMVTGALGYAYVEYRRPQTLDAEASHREREA